MHDTRTGLAGHYLRLSSLPNLWRPSRRRRPLCPACLVTTVICRLIRSQWGTAGWMDGHVSPVGLDSAGHRHRPGSVDLIRRAVHRLAVRCRHTAGHGNTRISVGMWDIRPIPGTVSAVLFHRGYSVQSAQSTVISEDWTENRRNGR